MALDLYVGGFARYFALDWENVGQKQAKESGMEYRIIRPDGPPQAADWDEAAGAVGQWREAINGGLGDALAEPLSWDETHDAPYFSDRPGYDGYGALVIWAAHAEAGGNPPEQYNEEWFEDEAVVEVSTPKEGQKYRPIVCGNLWLPSDFMFSFDFQGLTGQKVHICSNLALQQSLAALNETTFKMNEAQIAESLQGGYEENAPLQQVASFGFAVMQDMCDKSVKHHLPIMLDM